MKNYKTWIFFSGAALTGGVLISFLLNYLYPEKSGVFPVSLTYSIALTAALFIVYRFTSRKLSVFSFWQSWVLRSLFYVLAVSLAILIGFVIQTAVFVPKEKVTGLVIDSLIEGFVYLLTIPFSRAEQPGILSENSQRMAGLLFLLIFAVGIAAIIIGYVELRWREIRNQQMIDSAELKVLKSQIAPHFLFNTINTIVSVIREDPERAETLLIKLSDLLRYQFRVSGKLKVSLEEELNFTRNYLELLKARFPDKLKIKWLISNTLDHLEVPPLILQPLIENSVKHGWQNREQILEIVLEQFQDKGMLCIRVQDNGGGISESALRKLPRTGHALQNIHERLKLHYGQSGLLKIESDPDQITCVTIMIPENK